VGRVTLESTEGIAHEDYDDNLLLNDIALIKLPEAVDLTAGTIARNSTKQKLE
jgi:hypothetical protein